MDALDRLYRRVADVLLRQPDTQVTVGDLYQNLVPYRQVRTELGFGELAQYEHALLRLLAGERDYLIVERPEVQEELQRELRAPNPILGVYRDYAGVGIYLNPFAPDVAVLPPAAVAPTVTQPAPAVAGAPAGAPAPAPVAAPALAAPPRAKACPGCRTPLPGDRQVRFCPFCGKCLVPLPCAECSSMVEPEWKFCASCGWPREPGQSRSTPPPEQRLR
jgi:hypothetical protein